VLVDIPPSLKWGSGQLLRVNEWEESLSSEDLGLSFASLRLIKTKRLNPRNFSKQANFEADFTGLGPQDFILGLILFN